MHLGARVFAALVFGALLFGPLSPPLRAQVAQEHVEAAYLAKFARYVTWPQTRRGDGNLQLCIVGQDPFGRTLDQAAAGERIAGRSISVRRTASERGAAGCHIAYVQGASQAETRSLLNSLSAYPVLTVTSSRGGSRRGIVHFVVQDQRVRFYIDEARAARQGLSISSRLLALALAVNREPSR